MNMVIATGCSCSGWEVVLPTLDGAGLENHSQAVSQWHEQMLASSGVSDSLALRQSLRPDSRMENLLASLLPVRPAMPVFVADSCSLWLLDFWATKYPEADFLLFFCCAETAVASALISGIDPARFVEGWKAASRHMMQFQRRHRGRALLLNAEVASQHPHAFIAASRLAGVSLQLPTDWAKPQPVTFPEMARFLAKRIVANDPSLAALQLELEARSQPVGGSTAEDSAVGLDDLVKCYLELLQDRKRVGSELRQSRVEFEKLFLDQQELGKTLDTTQAELQQMQARLREGGDVRKKLEAANEALAASGKEAQEENELLLKQLHQVQEELEKLFLDQQDLGKTHKATQAELQQVQARLREVDNARSKLEAANQALAASGKEAQEENELLLKQLHQVQEELEKLFLDQQDLGKTHKATQAELQQVQARLREVDNARSKLEAANQALAAIGKAAQEENELLLKQLHQVQEELEKLFLDQQDLGKTHKATQAELQQVQARLREVADDRNKLEAANQALAASGKSAQEENELLLKQLHQVQEELEHYFLKYQETLTPKGPVAAEKAPDADGIPTPEGGGHAAIEPTRPNVSTSHRLIRGLIKPFKRRDKAKERIRRQVDVLDKSGLFDQAWYLSTYPDVASAGANPTEHYLRFGAAEGRNPSPAFDTLYYLQSNPDVAAAGVNPLLHYIQFGISEGRQPCSGKARF